MAMKAYVSKYHATGPAWNAAGGDLAAYTGAGARKAAGAPPPPPPPGAPPPPPPPPPPGFADAPKPAAKGGMNAVFAELNKGTAVTSGLRKVTADMKTKNRADRSGKVPDGPAKKVRGGPLRRRAVARARQLPCSPGGSR